jgi:hypothetical protein
MFWLILASSAVLGYVIDLRLWQGIVFSAFVSSAYLTGRRLKDVKDL